MGFQRVSPFGGEPTLSDVLDAVQEADRKIESLSGELAELKVSLAELRERITELADAKESEIDIE